MQPKAKLAPRSCYYDKKKCADSLLAIVIEGKDNVTTEIGSESLSPEVKESVTTEVGSESVSPEVKDNVTTEVSGKSVFSEVSYGDSIDFEYDSISTEVSDISAEVKEDNFSAEKFPRVQKINQVV